MPQFDVSTYMPQIFWVLSVFFCYWLIMDKFLIPKISEMVEARKRKYNDFILRAEEINKKAQESLAQYEDTLSAAHSEAAKQIAENERELKELISQKEEKFMEELSFKMTEYEAKLKADKEDILKKTDELSLNLAHIAVQQLNLPSITRADIEKLVKKGGSL